jgi:hypothetical protein
VDHGFRTGFQGFIIAGQAPVEHEPAKCSLYHPTPFYDVKSGGLAFSRDDFHVDADGGAVLNGGVLESAVGPGFGNGRVGVLGLVEEVYSDGVFGQAGGGNGDGEDQAERVGDDASLAAHDFLAGIGALAGQRDVGGGLDALGVNDGGGRPGTAAFFYAGQAGQLVAEPGEYSLVPPGGVIGVDSSVGREVVRQVFPCDSRPVEIQDRVEDIPQVGRGRLSGGAAVDPGLSPCGKDRFDQGPASVGNIGGVRGSGGHAQEVLCRTCKASEAGESGGSRLDLRQTESRSFRATKRAQRMQPPSCRYSHSDRMHAKGAGTETTYTG